MNSLIFFRETNSLVGFSIDGPKKINDLTRFDRGNNSTFTEVMNKIKILKKHNVHIRCYCNNF